MFHLITLKTKYLFNYAIIFSTKYFTNRNAIFIYLKPFKNRK
jgi:hypothetical protein